MKRYVQLLTMLFVLMIGTQVSFAGLWENGVHKEDIYNKDRMMEIETLAIANPLYAPADTEVEPSKEYMTDIIFEASETDKNQQLMYIPYRDVCQKIKDDQKVDVLRLERRKSAAIFKKEIWKYADAYLEVTVSNDTRLNIFYSVYDAKTNEVMYTYRKLAPKESVRDKVLYTDLSKDFYNDFLSAIRKAKEEKEKEEKAIIKANAKAEKKAKEEKKTEE